MPYRCIFVEEVVTFLGAITDKLVWTLVCGRNLNIRNDQVKVAAKNINAKIFACKLWVKRVGTFGVVLYRNKWPLKFFLHVTELHIGSSIRCENTLFGYHSLKCYIVKLILISFNCFSEYRLFGGNREWLLKCLIKTDLQACLYYLIVSCLLN